MAIMQVLLIFMWCHVSARLAPGLSLVAVSSLGWVSESANCCQCDIGCLRHPPHLPILQEDLASATAELHVHRETQA